MRVARYPPRAAQEHVRAWREEQLRDLASGARTTALGVRPCYCKRRWPCDLCGEPFPCWNVWPFLWETLPAELHRKKLCRRCYSTRLLDAIEATTRSGIELDPEPRSEPSEPIVHHAPRRLPPMPPVARPGPRLRHYRRR